jgi:hypothetical protein
MIRRRQKDDFEWAKYVVLFAVIGIIAALISLVYIVFKLLLILGILFFPICLIAIFVGYGCKSKEVIIFGVIGIITSSCLLIVGYTVTDFFEKDSLGKSVLSFCETTLDSMGKGIKTIIDSKGAENSIRDTVGLN